MCLRKADPGPPGIEVFLTGSTSEHSLSTMRLILVPGVITLAVTILRLVSELRHWSKVLFDPVGAGAIVGITWLAPVFGIYFALKLSAANDMPRSFGRSIVFVLWASVVMLARDFLAQHLLPDSLSFRGWLVFLWSLFALAGLLTLPSWPRLWKALLAYGYAARIPVVVVMLLALRGRWGTHYDYVPRQFRATSFVEKWLWLGFLPQLTFWVGYTIVSGMLFGTITGAMARARRRTSQAAS